MPEIPEIASRALEMNCALIGKKIVDIEVLQPKCLNLPPQEFSSALANGVIKEVVYHGKWIMVNITQGWLLLNMGMGGEIRLTTRDQMPVKYRLVFDFSDETCLVVNFWWFGYAYFAKPAEVNSIPMIAKLGPNVLDLSFGEFDTVLSEQKGKMKVKAFMLDQSKIAGIGNAYIHDILFLAKLHPNRPINSLSSVERANLFTAIQNGLLPSLRKGGAFYETNLLGEKGGFTMDDILIGYKEGSSCPVCRSTIMKIRTGSTSSFICPKCQQEPPMDH